MAWIELTAADVEARLSGPELAHCQRALADFQSDPTPEILSQVADDIRGYLLANAENRVGPAGTIPAQLKRDALAVAVWELGNRLGMAGKQLLTLERKGAMEAAVRKFEMAAKGEYVVEQPPADEDGPETGPAVKPSAFGSEERFTP